MPSRLIFSRTRSRSEDGTVIVYAGAGPGSRGLSPAECKDASLPELASKIEGLGGAVLATADDEAPSNDETAAA